MAFASLFEFWMRILFELNLISKINGSPQKKKFNYRRVKVHVRDFFQLRPMTIFLVFKLTYLSRKINLLKMLQRQLNLSSVFTTIFQVFSTLFSTFPHNYFEDVWSKSAIAVVFCVKTFEFAWWKRKQNEDQSVSKRLASNAF